MDSGLVCQDWHNEGASRQEEKAHTYSHTSHVICKMICPLIHGIPSHPRVKKPLGLNNSHQKPPIQNHEGWRVEECMWRYLEINGHAMGVSGQLLMFCLGSVM